MTLSTFVNTLSAFPDDYTVFGSSFNDYQLLVVDIADRDAYAIDYSTGWSPYYFEFVAASNDYRLTVKEIIDRYTTVERYASLLDSSYVRLVYNSLKYDVINATARNYPKVEFISPDVEDETLLVAHEHIEPYLKLDIPINPYKSRTPSFQPEDPSAHAIKLNYTLNELIYLAIHGVLPDSYYERYNQAVEEAKQKSAT